MTDEQVSPGDVIVTSGGDQIFPKGLTVGTVMKVSPGADLFLNIRVKPSANLSRLEEVLVITKKEDRAPSLAETNSVRAVDILTQRLPSVPDKPAADANQPVAEPPASAAKSSNAAAKPQGNAGLNQPGGRPGGPGRDQAGHAAKAGAGRQKGGAANLQAGSHPSGDRTHGCRSRDHGGQAALTCPSLTHPRNK